MLEEIRVQVMRLIGKNEKKLRTWVTDLNPECMKLYIDYRAIAHGCKVEFNRDWGYEVSDGEDIYTVNPEQKKCTCKIWDLSGIPCRHAIKALTQKKVDSITEMHWWYSKEAYMLTYKYKMQPVRGQKFWKVDPSSAMLPPDVVKQLGRPKMNRNREPDEARKRKGEWSQSRKGTQMTCSNCGESNHNVRSCYKEKCTENNAHSKNGKRPMSNDKHGTDVEAETEAATQEFEPYDPDVEDDEDPPLRPMVICELELRAERLKTRVVPTGARKI
ncbi:uncharacterized protein LOC125832858 [Solanum verrucosum]|nr:uncharacterized protein LOC125832858 [Solanum verrucosum]